MDLRISVEKSWDLKMEKFVSTYMERSKKFLEKFSFAFAYLRKWFEVGSW